MICMPCNGHWWDHLKGTYKVSEVHAFWYVREVVGDIMRPIGICLLANLLFVFVFLVKVLHEARSGILLHVCSVYSWGWGEIPRSYTLHSYVYVVHKIN